MRTIIISLLLITTLGLFAKDYKGAEIYSTESWKYGKIEMRMRMVKGSGILSTFFTYKNGSELSGEFWEEIDLEVFGKNNATTFQSNIITNNPKKYSEQVHNTGFSMADGYHTFTLEWTPDYVAWYVDGVEMRKTQGSQQVRELTNPQSLRFNIWAPNITEWVGSFDTSVLPVYQFVNWIKYSAYTPGSGDNGSDFSLRWTDEFDTFNTSRWSKADWTFGENLADFDPNNVLVKDGYLVLVLSRAGQTGFSGTVPADKGSNPKPTVSITSPSANASFCSGSEINIVADASVTSGSVKKVDFYDGNTLIGTDNSSPYSYKWTGADAGDKTIRAIATSDANEESIVSTVDITVNESITIEPRIQINGGSWMQQSSTEICTGNSVVVSPDPNTSNGWKWTGPDNFTASNREITLNNVTETQSGKYVVTYNEGECESSAEITITVKDIPSAPTVTSPVVYTHNSVADALEANGTNLTWYSSETDQNGSETAPIPSTSVVGNTSYFVSQKIGTCESSKAEIVVTINSAITQKILLQKGWNLIGYPFHSTQTIQDALSGIIDNVSVVKNMTGFYDTSVSPNLNSLSEFTFGKGYCIYVSEDCELIWTE